MKYIMPVVGLVILALLVMEFNNRMAELNRLQAEQMTVEARLLSKAQTLAALDAQIAYATSEAAVVQWAYENHMALPDDQVVVPVGEARYSPTPPSTPTPTPTPVNHLQQWLWLFFDTPPALSRP